MDIINAMRFITQPGISIRSPVGYRAAGEVTTTETISTANNTANNAPTYANTDNSVMVPADANKVIGACLVGAVIGFTGAAIIGYKIARSAMGGA